MNRASVQLRIFKAVSPAFTKALRILGLRERWLQSRAARARSLRRAEEAQGSDRLSHPALYDMDRKLNEIIDRDNGFFVEAGANDGFTQSNTYWLERFRGWRGVLVEPMEELAAQARLERPDAQVFRCALVSTDYTESTVTMQFGDLMSTVKGTHEDSWAAQGTELGWRDPYEAAVPARTLSAVLDEASAPEIDLLSLDVEGFELSVLQGLDFTRHAPRWILIEVHDIPTGQPPLDALFGEQYVMHQQLSPNDLLFRRV